MKIRALLSLLCVILSASALDLSRGRVDLSRSRVDRRQALRTVASVVGMPHATAAAFAIDGDGSERSAAEAVETVTEKAEAAARQQRIAASRARMAQARSSTRREDVFELSRQRAALYNTTSRAWSCPPGMPCI